MVVKKIWRTAAVAFAICTRKPALLLLMALSGLASAQQSPDAKSNEPPAQKSPAPNALTQAAVQQGILNCAFRINQLTQLLGFNDQSGALLLTPPNAPDQRVVPLAMEIPLGADSAYVSMQFAPNQANGCGASYDAVVYWPKACDEVARQQFAGMRNLGVLKKNITALDGGLATKVFLMAAGSGCLSIKKEVVL